MFTHIEALVGSVDNHGILQQAVCFQIIKYAAHVTVYGMYDAHVVVHVLLVLPLCQRFS